MPLETKPAVRKFFFQQQPLPDLDPNMSVEAVRQHYVKAGYSTLSDAILTGPKNENGTLIYTFQQATGYKG